MNEARDKLIFALDVQSLEAAQNWVERLQGKVKTFKVGKQLFTRCGPEVVHLVRGSGAEVFLDLKYHDIPNTVGMAGLEAMQLGVSMFNVHALGGYEMMANLVDKVNEACASTGGQKPLLLAVTILTSSNDETLRRVGIDRSVKDMVVRLADLAKQAGMDGVVASPQEVRLIRDACGPDFKIVTPGVRPAFASQDDQRRVTTPAEAIELGADYLVVGRPISAAVDPIEAAEQILQEIQLALIKRRESLWRS
jgi:orotidine-5'-phosphate decarboxylase